MQKFNVLITVFLLASINLIAQTSDVLTGLMNPQGIILNGNDLYIANASANKISKIDITATTPTAIDVITGLAQPRQLLLNGNDLYIAEVDLGKISKIDITSTTPTTTDVITGLAQPQGMVLHGNDLYIAEVSANKIIKIDITDSTPTATDVVTGLLLPVHMALNGNDLYITEVGSDRISKIDITDSTPTATEVVAANDPLFITIHGNEMYIAHQNENKISKFDITDPTPTTTNVVTGLNLPAGIAIKNNTIYISEFLGNKIVKSSLSALSVNDNLINDKIRMFPNPASDFVQVSGLTKSENYTIINTLGAIIKNGRIENQEKIDIRSLTNGVYFLKLDNGSTFKFIKE